MTFHPRANFSHSIKRAAIARATNPAGIVICECHRVPQLMVILDHKPCGVALVTGHIRFEHIICDEIREDVSLDNCAVLTTTCWRLKTDRYDLPVIAKVKRQADRHVGIRGSSRPLPGAKDDPRRRTVAGEVVDRETGERWER
jgi:hypothetical protein